MRKLEKRLVWALVALLTVFTGCGEKTKFVQQSSTQFFTQDFIPEYVDILWMINDMSPMYAVRDHLRAEASKFFARLDGVAHQYQMGFVTADMKYARGRLAPKNAPVVLTKSTGGTVEQRTAIFANAVLNNLFINLKTDGIDRGFESVYNGLTINKETNPSFVLRDNVPLVVVMISDYDDHSAFTGTSAVDYWAAKFLELKGNQADLLRVYSINYTATGDRCTNNKGGADINQATFEDRYFELATKLNGQTADLCGAFADDIDLTGLQLQELKTRFMLDTFPNPSTIQVSVLLDGTSIPTPAWRYEAATNEIVFDVAPPEGTTISVTFLPGNGT